jgi:glycosyltransferase involved in cell wall biosynthesis
MRLEKTKAGSDARRSNGILLSIVTPFYNESASIDLYFRTLRECLDAITGLTYEVICVNDGSDDDTLQKLTEISKGDRRVVVVDLSRNFGKEAALTAGLDVSRGDAVVPFDADLQDPPEVIPQLLDAWDQGAEVVVARRVDRSADSWAKRESAAAFYRLHNWLSRPGIPANVGDFRLMDRVVVDAIGRMPERQRFMKGLFAWVGFKTAVVDYSRPPRVSGDSRFSAWKLWNLALEALTSFSTAPLRIWTYIGFFVSLLAFLYGSLIVVTVLVRGVDVPGYASLLVTVLLIGGVQLIGIGVLGEYVGRIYSETKQRPVYVIREVINRE